MTHLIVFLTAYLLDALLGDPAWLPHPVVAMGRAITGLEHLLRRLFSSTNTGLLAAGCVLAALLPLGSFCIAAGALLLSIVGVSLLVFLVSLAISVAMSRIPGLKKVI